METNKDSKEEVITALNAPAQAGEIYIRRDMREWLGEWRSYPNTLTKDLLDMTGRLVRCGYWTVRRVADGARREVPERARPKVTAATGGRSAVTGY